MAAEKTEQYNESTSSNSKKLLLENKKIAIMRGATLEQGAQRVCGNSIPGNFQISVTEAKYSSLEALPALSGSLGYDLQKPLPTQIFFILKSYCNLVGIMSANL